MAGGLVRSAPAGDCTKRQHILFIAQWRKVKLHLVFLVQHDRPGADQHEAVTGHIAHGTHEAPGMAVIDIEISMQLVTGDAPLETLVSLVCTAAVSHARHDETPVSIGWTCRSGMTSTAITCRLDP